MRLSEAAFVAAYRAIERARNQASRCTCEHPQAEHTDGRCSAIVVGEAHSAARCSCRRFRLRDSRELGPLNEALAWLESINLAQ